MAASTTSPTTSRAEVVADLLHNLEILLLEYSATHTEKRLDQEAEKITGEIGRHLYAARQRLAAAPRRHG